MSFIPSGNVVQLCPCTSSTAQSQLGVNTLPQKGTFSLQCSQRFTSQSTSACRARCTMDTSRKHAPNPIFWNLRADRNQRGIIFSCVSAMENRRTCCSVLFRRSDLCDFLTSLISLLNRTISSKTSSIFNIVQSDGTTIMRNISVILIDTP